MEEEWSGMIVFKDLCVSKNDKPILNHLNGMIPESKFCVIIGPNGAGKTTLLRSLLGFYSEVTQQIFIRNSSLASYSLHARSKLVSWAAAGMSIPFAFKVYDVLLMSRYPWHFGQPSENDHKYVSKILEEMSLEKFSQRSVGSLSSGEQKQVNIARAVVQDTPILVCDEPCAHLDLAVSFKILDYLKYLSQKGKTIIISTHDMGKAARYSDYSILLHKGIIKSQGNFFPLDENIGEVFNVQVKRIVVDGLDQMIFQPLN